MGADAARRAGTATVLFTDLVGSTDLRRALGDDRADALRRQHDALIRAAIDEHDGTEVKGTGDGLMAVFAAAGDAMAAASAMQRAIERYNRRAVELQQLKKQQIESNYRGKDAAPEDDISDLLELYGDSI